MDKELWIIIGISVVAAIGSAIWIFGDWRHICQTCNTQKTSLKDEKGNWMCKSCSDKELIKEAEKNEENRKCPIDGYVMNKVVAEGTDIIIDKCPNCKAAFLDGGELEKITKFLKEERTSSGSSNLALGLIVGMSMRNSV